MKTLLTIIILFLGSIVHAQTDFITSLRVEQDDDLLVIKYKLEDTKFVDEYYLVNLKVTYHGNDINPSPEYISGDISYNKSNKIIPTNGYKKIVWRIMDEPDLNDVIGELTVNLKAKLYAVVPAGVGSAIYSAILPGWGDYKVNPGAKKPYWLISTAALGMAGAGIFFNIKSGQSQVQYLQAKDQSEINRLKSKYKNEGLIGASLLIGSGVVWLTDVILVGLKGLKNSNKTDAYLSNIQPIINKQCDKYSYGIAYRF